MCHKILTLVCLSAVLPLPAQSNGFADAGKALDVVVAATSRLQPFIERYRTDRANLDRSTVRFSTERHQRFKRFESRWFDALNQMWSDGLTVEERVDWHLFAERLRWRLAELDHDRGRDMACAPLLRFKEGVVLLALERRAMKETDGKKAAERLEAIAEAARPVEGDVDPKLAWRAAEQAGALRRMLDAWHRFHDGYDPLLSWWTKKPYERATRAIDAHASWLRERGGLRGAASDAIIGEPCGEVALLSALKREMIPYTPTELIAIAEKEMAWCEAEMDKASKALGFADWREAQDHVKNLHVAPGEQPALIRDLAHEAVAFLEERELVTIPELCKETWRMEMMSPSRQKVNPYFTGGEVISVSFPTDTMEHNDKLMSLRGNNRHFSRATVHHELIPGHHLQMFMTSRHRTWRRPFGTPFWLEGWALYWEMRLWDLGFPQGAEDRIGMLFWRKHRCARIIFSLGFHQGTLTSGQCVDLLVSRVGHERRNAEAEVRRSVRGSYPPLYQAAYMLGGLQLRALHGELVATGKMTERSFHDAVLHQGSIPIEMLRAALSNMKLPREHETSWRFYDN